MSVAYLPDGKQVASAPWDTREAAENDVYQQALMRLAPMPKFDPTKTYEQQIAERRANGLLEHCGHCPEDFDEPLDNPECPACGGPGVPLGSLGRRMHFRCRNCGYDFSQEPPAEPPISEGERVTIKGRPWGMKPGTKARVSRVFKNRKEGMGYDAEVRAKGWHPMRVKWKDVERMPPPKASFYPGSGGSAGVGGITSA